MGHWMTETWQKKSSHPEHKPVDATFLKHVQFIQLLSHVWLFETPWTAARQASLSITNSWSLLKLMSIESVMPSNHPILCHPFSSGLQSSPASGSFQMSPFFASGGQSIGISASASVLPMNIQDWFPLGWMSWISLQSKRLSRVFSNTTVQKHQFFGPQLYSPTSHPYMTNGKTIALKHEAIIINYAANTQGNLSSSLDMQFPGVWLTLVFSVVSTFSPGNTDEQWCVCYVRACSPLWDPVLLRQFGPHLWKHDG